MYLRGLFLALSCKIIVIALDILKNSLRFLNTLQSRYYCLNFTGKKIETQNLSDLPMVT